jgi:integrase/recombinase XerD
MKPSHIDRLLGLLRNRGNEQMSEETAAIALLLEQSLSAASPEAALHQPFGDLVQATLSAAARSTATRRSYQIAIGLFVQYLDQERGSWLPGALAESWRPFALPLTEGRRTTWMFRPPAAIVRLVDVRLLDGFRAWREHQGDSAQTATIRVYAVRTLLAVALRDGLLTTEQAQAMGLTAYRQRQKQPKSPVGRRLTPAEVRALRSTVDPSTCKGARDLAILDIMLYAGLRREEVADLDLAALRQDGGRWWLVLAGKGDKVRRLKVHDVLYGSLTNWCQLAGLALGTEGPVFRSFDRGDHVTTNSIDDSVVGRLVATCGYTAGIAAERGSNQLSPHDLRRTCARNAFENGASLLLVQAMLGHEDPKTTAHYIGAFEADDDTAVDYVRY